MVESRKYALRQGAQLPFGEDGNWDGFNLHVFQPKYHSTSELMLTLVPESSEGGVTSFLEKYHLEHELSEDQVRALAMGQARMGKRLAGILAVEVMLGDRATRDVATWQLVKNVYEKDALKNQLPEIDVSQEYFAAQQNKALDLLSDHFGAQLRVLRYYNLLSQEQLAPKVEVSTSAIGGYELDQHIPGEKILLKLLQALNVDPEHSDSLLTAGASLRKQGGCWPKGPQMPTHKNDRGPFAEMVTRLRVDRGFTQETLAAESGVSMHFIALVEAGKSQTDLDTLHRIADVLRIDKKTRFELLDKRSPGAIDKFDAPDESARREARKAWFGAETLLGGALRSLRKQRSILQRHVEGELDCSKGTISRYEGGATDLDQGVFSNILKVLDVPSETKEALMEWNDRRLLHQSRLSTTNSLTNTMSLDDALHFLQTERGLREEQLFEKEEAVQALVARHIAHGKGNITLQELADTLEVLHVLKPEDKNIGLYPFEDDTGRPCSWKELEIIRARERGRQKNTIERN